MDDFNNVIVKPFNLHAKNFWNDRGYALCDDGKMTKKVI